MAEKHNATCSICGGGYHVCHSCKDSIQLQPWKIHCCSADCYKVFQVVRGHSTGVYTDDEFKAKLQNIDLSNLDSYREHIKNIIKNALKEDVVEDVPTIVMETVVDCAPTEKMVIEKPVVSRKRNCKVEEEKV